MTPSTMVRRTWAYHAASRLNGPRTPSQLCRRRVTGDGTPPTPKTVGSPTPGLGSDRCPDPLVAEPSPPAEHRMALRTALRGTDDCSPVLPRECTRRTQG